MLSFWSILKLLDYVRFVCSQEHFIWHGCTDVLIIIPEHLIYPQVNSFRFVELVWDLEVIFLVGVCCKEYNCRRSCFNRPWPLIGLDMLWVRVWCCTSPHCTTVPKRLTQRGLERHTPIVHTAKIKTFSWKKSKVHASLQSYLNYPPPPLTHTHTHTHTPARALHHNRGMNQ